MDRPETVAQLSQLLRESGYLADRGLATALLISLSLGRPILIEGEVGVGKTEVAKALATVFGRQLIRLQCLADEPVAVIATPAQRPSAPSRAGDARVTRFIPHRPVLDRATCAITHGGMGATQKALAQGVPVRVVPFGRDQVEVARRVEIARTGTRLRASCLRPSAAANASWMRLAP